MEIQFFMCMGVLKPEFSADAGEQQFSHSCLLPQGIPCPGVMGADPQGQLQMIRGEAGSGQGSRSCRVCSALFPGGVLGNDGWG